MSSDSSEHQVQVDPSRLVRQLLQDWQLAGLSHAELTLPEIQQQTSGVSPKPSSTVNPSGQTPRPAMRPVRAPERVNSPSVDTSPPVLTEKSDTHRAPVLNRQTPVYEVPPEMNGKTLNRKQRIAQLEQLACQVAKCTRCQELAEQRTQTVFGVGDPEARIMFVGEAPGADEDKQGEPFVGRAGKLLNQIIEASQLKREELYICNILRCRPPGNRNPSPKEAEHCREYLDGQISLVDPEYIICWGTVAAQNLLGNKTPIGKLRRRFHDYQGRQVLCTYHPSYLLRNPSAKKDVWEDMKFFMSDLGVDLS